MKYNLLVTVALAAGLPFISQTLHAGTVVATINGYYDVDNYDTPSLHINNPTSYAFTNVELKLTGYQGLNNGITESVSLASIGAGTTSILTWGSIPGVSGALTPGNLFSYDYDDEYGGTFNAQNGYGLSSSHTLVLAPQCSAQGFYNCADVGNFYVTFTAIWDGKSVYSQFSPDPTLKGAGNAAGVYVGWEGLDPNGWSETTYDSHSNGGPNGVLADILLGSPPVVTPEPMTMALLGGGLIALAGLRVRRSNRKT